MVLNYLINIKLMVNFKRIICQKVLLLYFDHRTCRIERHLFKPNLVFMGKPNILGGNENSILSLLATNPYLYDGKGDGRPIIELNNEDISHYFQDGNISYNKNLLLEITFDLLADGKLTKNMTF